MTRRSRALAIVAVVGLVVVVAVGVAAAAHRSAAPERRTGPGAPSTRDASHPVPNAVDAGDVEAARRPVPVGSVAPLDPPSPPRSIDIPTLGVHSDLERLHLGPDGALEPPVSFGRAGWYAEGPQPGRPGPAVIAGHIDSTAGPAVFFHLDRLRPGDRVVVGRLDGTSAEFVVTGSRQFPKAAFPSASVYGPTPDPELRLITCSGAFDRASGHYVDNTVVTARLVDR